jgi:WhiB family redox-sensing transcriptional regulator
VTWVDHAACRGPDVDPGWFFVATGRNATAAKKVCSGCSVRRACLEYALACNEEFGIWGGASEKERRRLVRRIPA